MQSKSLVLLGDFKTRTEAPEVGWQEGLEPLRLSKRRGLAPSAFVTIRQVMAKEQNKKRAGVVRNARLNTTGQFARTPVPSAKAVVNSPFTFNCFRYLWLLDISC